MSETLHSRPLAELADLVRTRTVSPVEVVTASIERTEAVGEQLDAFITPMFETALAEARRAEAEIAAGGYRGPLHGIPYGLKDIYETAGVRTTAHSRTLIDNVPTEDATTVRRLTSAGGICLGKLATHEFAHGGPSFDLPWPPARNPWCLTHFTGGSSSGSAAAVAAGLLPMAMGSDTGGSIRSPAALCGLVGLKPTYGLVSRAGVIANSYSYDHAGPLTWTVRDAALSLQVLAGHDAHDPASADVQIPDYAGALHGDVRGLRIGVVRHFHERDLQVDEALVAAFEEGLRVLESLGATLVDVTLRTPHDYQHIKVVTAESELLSIHESTFRARADDFGDDFLGRVLPACLFTARDYLNSQRERRLAIAELSPVYAACDVIACIGPGPAPPLDAWRTLDFWKKGSVTAPFNVTGGPALVQCVGFTRAGLPLAWQLAGRPFDECTVLRVADAYERATAWRARRPCLEPDQQWKSPLPDPPAIAAADCGATDRAAALAAIRRVELQLSDRQLEMVLSAAPYVEDIRRRLATERRWSEEPANTFRAGAQTSS